jgi:hypothetical protein
MSILNTGAPHFKSVIKQHRHANYTLAKVLNEFIDNVIKKTNDIHIFTQVDDTGKLQEVKVSDNYIHGFDNLDAEGVHNPFNMGHIKIAHDDDTETSEFGVGMKAGALSAANQLNVYTHIKDSEGNYKYVEVICDFIRMSNETDVNSSYNPRIKLISYEEYKEQHPFEQGTTLKLSKIRDCIYSKTTQQDITNDVSNCVADTYSRFIIRGINLYVNEQSVQPKYDFFDDPKCEPFTITKELFILEKSGIITYLIRKTKEMSVWQEFNREKVEWYKLKEHNDGLVYIQELIKNGYKHVYSSFTNDGVCMNINTTFTFYSEMYHTKNPKSEPDLPEDSVYIYKDDRNYGKQSILKHNNGVHNYTLHEIDFVSKRVGKDLGITFNKEILMNGNNDLIIAIKSALMDSRSEFTADTHNGKNATLCEKAIKKGLINLQTCPEAKLSATHRSQRLCLNPPSVVSIKTPKPKKNNVVSKDDDSFSDLSETALVNTVEKSPTIINIVSVDTNVEQIEDKRLFDLLDIDPLDNESYPDGGVVKDIDKDVVEDVVKDVYKDIDEEVEILFDTDISNRRERTIAILDHLNNSLCGPDDCVLSVEILRVLESIFQ